MNAYKFLRPNGTGVFTRFAWPLPDGAQSAKFMWVPQKLEGVPFTAHVAGPLKHVDFMVKDSTRFAAIGGWGYAQFNYDPASDRFLPDGTHAHRCVGCGTAWRH